jgi:NAD(P)-dependent dehydrogenase (short-subunit alcohol dehydrogenase family)
MNQTDEQRIAVVTGGAGAIGGAIARTLTNAGHHVVILDREGDIPCDLGSAQSTKAAGMEVLDRYGKCDVLVHAAAAFDQGQLGVELSTWRQVQAVNVESALLLSQILAPAMQAGGFGRIVFIASDTVFLPVPEAPLPYVVSKAALIGLARSLALRLGPDGISVTAVAPGLTDTPLARTANTDDIFDRVVESQALKRRLTPEDVAATVAFLASDGAAALTGQVLCTDGGLVLR